MKNTIEETYNYPAIQIVLHTPIPAVSGWNMIGGYENSPTITSLKAANPQITGNVFGFNGVQYEAATNLVPGYGYWVKVTSDDDIVIPDVLSKGSVEVVELFKEDWGRIVITDARGISTTLYAVNGDSPSGRAGVDLNNYELPPLPPAGNFDIRFGSGRIAENLNNSLQTIEMSGIVYPVTVRVEGMDIRMQDVTGSALNVSLKSGEDVVISDATIQRLRVTGEVIPAEYSLEQNYPNPFNPSTVIEFSLPENVGIVKLSIYNALGEKVAELVNTALTAGKYQYQWNASNVATGIYIYELRTDNFVSMKKMILLK
ncbi:MAG: T9SS C-terminal target domain-containing protein [Geobacter sp.]|nr:MAG: T9SS C-terminal target domain-containing protein [Geobacter sp.]